MANVNDHINLIYFLTFSLFTWLIRRWLLAVIHFEQWQAVDSQKSAFLLTII